jgi:hypothetical protein
VELVDRETVVLAGRCPQHNVKVVNCSELMWKILFLLYAFNGGLRESEDPAQTNREHAIGVPGG